MFPPNQSHIRNRLIRVLDAADFALLQNHLVLEDLSTHQPLIAPNAPVDRLFFPETGIVSITTDGPRTIEVGLIGPEGVAGAAPVLLGTDRGPHKQFVQSAGQAFSIARSALEQAITSSPTLHRLLLRFVHTLMTQMAQTAYVNATFDIETRLARWLLMCQDRIGGNELSMTHEFLSVMLGVQRSSVTLAIQVLEGNRLIWGRRGRVEVRDRDGLIAAAGDAYGVPEAEYARVIGSP